MDRIGLERSVIIYVVGHSTLEILMHSMDEVSMDETG